MRQAALEDGRIRTALSPDDIDRALDPANYLGCAGALIDRALEADRQVQASERGPGNP